MKVRKEPIHHRPLERLDDTPSRVPSSGADPHPEPPLPSAAQWARREKASRGVPAWASYVASRERPHPGLAALDKRLHQIGKLASDGVKVRCVFDLDNTLFDTRWRTLHCARAFDGSEGSEHFAHLSDDELIGHIGRNGRETALALGLPDDVVERFAAYWDQAFWRPEALAHDRPMDPPLHLITEAMKRGAEVVFLTGRVERHLDAQGQVIGFRDASIAQLLAIGVEVRPEQLILKPDTSTRTAPFKAEVLRRFEEEGAIGFFVTEGIRDISHVREALPRSACFLLDCTFEKEARPRGVPVLPGRF